MNYYNEEILNLISDNILNIDVHELRSIYDVFNNEGIEKIEVERTKHNYQQFLKDAAVTSVQFDLPYFFDNKKDKTIMIIGMDAKASHSDKLVVLSTPYYLQSIKGRETNENDYWKIIKILSNTYNIYLTDVYKAYFEKESILSNKIPLYKKNILHAEILKKEILEVNPKAILCWGKASRDLVSKIVNVSPLDVITRDSNYPYECKGEFSNIKLVATPHPSKGTYKSAWLSFYDANLQGIEYSNNNKPEILANFVLSKVK
jgi:hypothetical protein